MVRDQPGYLYHRLVVGYRGCDRVTAKSVLLGGQSLRKSSNRYDWLGEGIYFWEHGHRRAAEFAQWKKDRGEIEEPVVLGAYIHLGRCFDLTDTWATSRLPDYFERLRSSLTATGEALPENRPAAAGDFDLVLRDLDCAVLNLALQVLGEEVSEGEGQFQTVRGRSSKVIQSTMALAFTRKPTSRSPSETPAASWVRPAAGYTDS